MDQSLIKFIYKIPKLPFTQPGWFVKKFTNKEKLNKQLHLLDDIQLSDLEIMRIKQFLCNFTFIFFFIYILVTGLFLKGIFLNLAMDLTICFLPETIFTRILRLKNRKIKKQLPDFIDALTMAIESGLNFNNAFDYVSSKTKGELGEETSKTKGEISFGVSQEEALQNMADRISIDDFTKFVSAIKQAKQLGVSIAETLKIQSDLIRTRRKQRAQELSQTAAVKISIPLVFCIFPALLIIYLMPGILRLFMS
ncbi:MAG: type II secretion system F family protein [Candidatus Peregrinibacteria bacterium]|nr:type II secretion system F family protein [Candidatus Peregrinibacteria bacterium]MDZ4244364.1 type II secretion system F family protein [Candidatus Gracilibacteria bacterium]